MSATVQLRRNTCKSRDDAAISIMHLGSGGTEALCILSSHGGVGGGGGYIVSDVMRASLQEEL